MKTIDLHKSNSIILPSISDEEASLRGKGWTYSNVYSLKELKDVYLVIKDNQGKPKNEIFSLIQNKVVPEGKSWDSSGRRALEYINALNNFQLIKGSVVIEEVFANAKLNQALTEEDINDFKNIFFSYFRFKEIISWFISSELEKLEEVILSEDYLQKYSKPLFYYSGYTRFTDSIIYELKDNADIYLLNPGMLHLMRFWDVFIKWGTTLNLIEKFSLTYTDYKVFDKNNIFKYKNLSCCYFINKTIEIDFIEFININYKSKHIYIPDLLLRAALLYRLPLEELKSQLINQAQNNGNRISFERTSSIFLKRGEFKGNEDILFPKFRGSYVTHITLRS